MSLFNNSRIDENYYASKEQYFIAPTAYINVGTAETPVYLFKHPTGTGKKIVIVQLNITINGSGTIRLYHTPTITTNGTAITPVNRYIKTSPASSVATPFFSPTISANGTLINLIQLPAQQGTTDIIRFPIYLDPNFNLLITAANGANNTPTSINPHWIEKE